MIRSHTKRLWYLIYFYQNCTEKYPIVLPDAVRLL